MDAITTSNPEKYLFINSCTDPSSLRKTTRCEIRRRNEFVQRGRRHAYPPTIFQPSRKQKLSPRRDDATTTPFEECKGTDRNTSCHTRPNRSNPSSQKHIRSPQVQCRKHPVEDQCSCRSSMHALNCPVSRGYGVDPFRSAALEIDVNIFRLLQFYQTVYHPSIWHIETRLSRDVNAARMRSASLLLQDALQDRLLMMALLASSAARLEHMSCLPGYMSQYFLGVSAAELRTWLKGSSNQTTHTYQYLLKLLPFLMAAEGFCSEFEAAEVHINMATTLTAQIGGLAKIERIETREMLIKCIVSIHSVTFQPCPIDIDDCFNPGVHLDMPAASSFVAICSDLSNMPIAFQYILDQDDLCPALTRLVYEVSACSTAQRAFSEVVSCAAPEVARWLYYSDIHIRYRLLNLTLTDAKLHFLRLGLLIWVFATLTSLGQTPIAAVMSQNLQKELCNLVFEQYALTADIGLWILTLGALFAADGSSTQEWFVQQLYDNTAMIGMTPFRRVVEEDRPNSAAAHNRRNLQSFAQRVFFAADLHGPKLERLVQKLTASS